MEHKGDVEKEILNLFKCMMHLFHTTLHESKNFVKIKVSLKGQRCC